MQMDGFLTLKGGNVELVGAPETIFDHVYAEPHAGLAQQRAEYVEYVAGFDGEGSR